MRTVYLGTSAFAAAVLQRLAASRHAPALVVTRPDAPRGRGRKLLPPPVAETARALGIELIQPERVNESEAVEQIAAAGPEAVCVCAYGAILREPLLSRWPMLNVHPSLLPRWRGAAPLERAIMAGDIETGVSIMRPVAELDAGPFCLQRVEPIGPEDTYGTLAARLERLSGELLVEALDQDPPFVEQPDDGVTYAEKIVAADRDLDPEQQTAVELDRRIRALTPHIGARLRRPDESFLRIAVARPLPDVTGPAPGELAGADGRLLLGTAAGALELLEVQPAGGRPMAAADYLRGYGV